MLHVLEQPGLDGGGRLLWRLAGDGNLADERVSNRPVVEDCNVLRERLVAINLDAQLIPGMNRGSIRAGRCRYGASERQHGGCEGCDESGMS